MLLRQNNICMGAALGSQYGAMAVAAEILIAQLHSQSKLTTAWHENRKIQYENEFLMCRNVGSIEWHQKTYHEISWDYPFKAKGKTSRPPGKQLFLAKNGPMFCIVLNIL
jgi:hypothetical protein